MISDGYGIVSHDLISRRKGLPVKKIGHRIPLIDIAAVQQEREIVPAVLAVSAHVLYLVGNIGETVGIGL